MSDTELKPGDVVKPKSGGPRMAIETIEDDHATCSWFVQDEHGHWGGPHRDKFHKDTLVTDDSV